MTKTPATITPARMEQITALLNGTDFSGGELHPLAGDASFRRYIRIKKDGKSAMLMDAPPEKENVRPYIAVARYLFAAGYSAPDILAEDAPGGLLLLEDLGDESFTLVLKNTNGAQRERLEQELYASAIDVLSQWHEDEFSNPQALKLPVYDGDLLLKEVALFTDWYLPQVVGKEKAANLRGEYMRLWETVLNDAGLQTHCWVHRDYHADNLMWLPSRSGAGRVGLLDFQDGVYGDAAYDMVSLLEDARRDVDKPLADAMIERYIANTGADANRFRKAYAVLGAQRNSKIVGIFARLAARDNKFQYLNYLPRVWRHLEQDLAHPALAPLKQWTDRHIAPEFRGVIQVSHTAQQLMSA